MSLGHSRRFGAGVTSLHQADDMHEVQVVYQERRQRQHDIKESLQAIDAYRFEQQRVQDEKQGTRPRHLSESLSTTSMKIGQSPAPYLNKKKQEWVPWEASEFQRQRERDELWQNLTDKSGLSSFHGTSSKHERLNPITHQPLSPDRGYGGGGGGGDDDPFSSSTLSSSGSTPGQTTLVERAQRLERSLSVPSFSPSPVQLLRPFTLAEFRDADKFVRRNPRRTVQLPLSTPATRRLDALVSPVKKRAPAGAGAAGGPYQPSYQSSYQPLHQSPYQPHTQEKRRAQPGFSGSGLLDMNLNKREQYHAALVQEMKATNEHLYEEDVLRVSSIYFLPMHLIRVALKNATSIRSDDCGRVNLDVFMRRLCGEIEIEEEEEEEEEEQSWTYNSQRRTNRTKQKFSPKSSSLSPKLSGRMPWSTTTQTQKFQLQFGSNVDEDHDYPYPQVVVAAKSMGTQTGIYGDYGTSLSEMESIVEKHEMKTKVQSRIRTLLQKQKDTMRAAKDSRHELAKNTTQRQRQRRHADASGLSNGGLGLSSGGGSSSSMKGIFDYSSTSGSDADALAATSSLSPHDDNDDDLSTSVLDRDDELLTKALSESMREVKKCRNALNVANFVVTELRTKNEHLVQQSFRKKFDANSSSSKVVESKKDDTTAMAVPLPTNDFFEVREDVDGGVEESPAAQ